MPLSLSQSPRGEIAFSSSRVMLENDKFLRNKQEKWPPFWQVRRREIDSPSKGGLGVCGGGGTQ